jgi:hypothetical protein
MRQIETDLRSPLPPQAPLTPPRFDAEQYFAEGGAVHMAGGGPIYDELGNVIAGDNTDYRNVPGYGAVEAASVGAGRAGQAVGEALMPAARGMSQMPAAISGYAGDVAASEAPISKVADDIGAVGRGMAQAAYEDPAGFVAGMLPVVGNVIAAKEAREYSAKAEEARAEGDLPKASSFEKMAAMSLLAVAAPVGAGAAAKGLAKGAEKAAVRELSPLGFYSHGAETAAGLPQAKGTPQQMAGVLRQAGVRPEEMFTSGFADEAATMARRTQIEAEYAPKIEAAKQAVDALNPESPEFAKALLDPKSPESKAKRQYDNTIRSMRGDAENALVLSEDFASRPSVTREEIAVHFKERMPQIEETVLGTPRPEQMKALRDEYARAEYGEDFSGLASEYKRRIDDLIMDRRSTTKFGQYTLPGGENYREVLLKMPEGYGAPKQALDDLAAARQRFKDLDKRHTDELHAGLTGDMNISYEDFDKLTRERDIAESRVKNFEKLANQPAFQSGHWQDPNVLAHLRMADRTGPNGEKILHVEEIQSDWGQKGKKEGFKVPLTPELESSANSIIENKLQPGVEFMNPSWKTKEGKVDPRAVTPSYVEFLEKNGTISPDEAKTLQSWNKARGFDASGVPTAPYVTNTQAWTDLALKRALREAAEGGYDKLVWTPGAEQAKRYSLSNQVDALKYIKEPDGTFSVIPVKNNQNLHNLEKSNVSDKELESLFGRDVAEKMKNNDGSKNGDFRILSGQDLEMGGEGMKGYYDKIVPNQLSKLVKKLDPEARIEMGRLPVEGSTRLALDIARELGTTVEQIQALPHEQRSELINSVRNSIAAPSLTITPKMREAIMKGQTAYAEGGEVEAAPKKSEPAFRTIDEQVTAVASDLANIARKDHLDQRHLAYLLKVASGMYMPPERAMEFAGQIMLGDAEGLISRFKTYRPSIRTFARLNQMMGGKHQFMSGDHMGGAMMRMKGEEALMRTKENAESMMDSDVVKSRPAMKKALEAFNKRI